MVDDTTDTTMKQLRVREGAPYSFIAKIVENDALSSVVPVDAGATMTTDSFTLPESAEVELPSALRGWHGSDFEFCLGLDECMVGFEFVLNPKPSIVGMRFVTQEGQLYTASDKLRFEAQFDRNVEVEGTPQLSFKLGDGDALRGLRRRQPTQHALFRVHLASVRSGDRPNFAGFEHVGVSIGLFDQRP